VSCGYPAGSSRHELVWAASTWEAGEFADLTDLRRQSEDGGIAMSRRQRFLVGALFAVLTVGLLAPAALAVGSFSWGCDFVHRCVSRTYSTNLTGQHSITQTQADCPGPGSNVRYRIVHEEFGSDTFYAWKTVSCGPTDQTKNWAIPQTGDFHFDAEKADTTDTTNSWHITGSTSYP